MPMTPVARARKWLLHIIFLLTGVGTVLIGQALPIMAAHFSLNDFQVSFFFPSQFAGSILGSLITNKLGMRNNYMLGAVTGAAALAAGALLLNIPSFAFALIGFFIIGGGIGLTLPAINMMVIDAEPERAGPNLYILNFCWGVGAIICKPFVDYFRTAEGLGAATYLIALPLFISCAALAWTARGRAAERRKAMALPPDDTPIWQTPLAWTIALFNFVHVGFESGMGGWLTTYTDRLEGSSFSGFFSPTLLYFTLFVAGRGVAPAMFRFLDENKMLFLGLSIMLLGMIVTLAADNVSTLMIGAAVAGFGTSWIFPTNVSRFSKTFGPGSTRRATPLFICGTLGAVVVTWLIGYLSNRSGDLRYGMFVLGGSIAVLLALQAVLAIWGRNARVHNGA